MNEESHLEEALNQYKTQFLQIQAMLTELGEEGQTELVNIRNDLMELITVTEESLLSLKKRNLLHLVEENQLSSTPSSSSGVEENIYNTDGSVPDENDQEYKEELEEHSVTGMKCRIPYVHAWGVMEEQNAMVLDVEDGDDDDGSDTKVRVLFTHPTHSAMLCCPYFIDGKCKYSEQDCRYSHGYVVSLEDLLPFKEPDFSNLKVGHSCLARYEDGLWYKAMIKSVDDSEVTVHYDSYNVDGTVPIEGILPQDFVHERSDDVEEMDDFSDVDDEDDDVIVAEFVGPPKDKTYTSSGAELGEWEIHTRGIGSKLMAKMGYISGQGLGKDSDGRVEPVEVVLLPAGKSLDKCVELRENHRLIEPFKKKKPKVNKGKTLNPSTDSANQIHQKLDVFEFINNKLHGKRGTLSELQTSIKSIHNGATASERLKKMKKTEEKTNWNLQLFKVQEQITAVEKTMLKEKQALSRNAGRDSGMTRHVNSKISSIENQLKQLREQEKNIKRKIHHKTEHKKLTEF